MTFGQAGESFQALNHQGTPLLQSNPKSSHYGANDSTETLAKCHVDIVSVEGTDLDEVQEQRSLFTKSIECHSKTIELKTGLNVHMFPSLRHVLTRGWCDKASLRLQNCGSVARDHLALERTFLAYTRTSLTTASAGVALVQLCNVSHETDSERAKKFARPLGASLIAMGLLVLGIGLIRYFVVQSSLVQGSFPVTRLSPILIAVTSISLVTMVFWFLLAGY